MKQAIIAASIFEFAGAFFMGKHVTKTIRKGITSLSFFEDEPEILMWGMMCVSISTAFWLITATYYKLPVSTTHTCVGGVMGFAIAYKGFAAVEWDVVTKIILSWVFSPVLSAIFAVALQQMVVYGVLLSENPRKRTLMCYPLLIFFTVSIICFYTVYKGTPQLELDETPVGVSIGISLAIAAFCALVSYFTMVPYLNKRMESGEWLKDTAFMSAETPESEDVKQKKPEEESETNENNEVFSRADEEHLKVQDVKHFKRTPDHSVEILSETETETDVPMEKNEYSSPQKIVETEMVKIVPESPKEVESGSETPRENKKNFFNIGNIVPDVEKSFKTEANEDLLKMLAAAHNFDEGAEYMFSYLQVVTACFDAFAHGANDVANSIGPLAAVYSIWESGQAEKKSDVPMWVLALGGVGIIMGLVCYGAKIIQAIGFELTKLTPHRGFAIELGAACVVLTGARLEIPLSTTHCQVGATIGIGLTEGVKNLNGPLIVKILSGWVVTLIIAGLSSAIIFSFGVYSPKA
eukprot:UN30142